MELGRRKISMYEVGRPTWNTVTVAHSRESKFFLSQTPVSGSQNLHPNRFIPRILKKTSFSTLNKKLLFFKAFSIHLKIKMNKASNPKNTATLSIVFSITINCLRRFGRNLTSFRILSSRNVLNTDNPDPSSVTPYTMPLYNSIALNKIFFEQKRGKQCIGKR